MVKSCTVNHFPPSGISAPGQEFAGLFWIVLDFELQKGKLGTALWPPAPRVRAQPAFLPVPRGATAMGMAPPTGPEAKTTNQGRVHFLRHSPHAGKMQESGEPGVLGYERVSVSLALRSPESTGYPGCKTKSLILSGLLV